MEYLEETVRPWGIYRKLYQNDKTWVKYIEVSPRSQLSLQKHLHRSEKWIVIQGQGVAVVNYQSIEVGPGSVIEIPLGAIHRMSNPYGEYLVFVEVVFGDLLSEDDIVRLEDDYNRVERHNFSARF